MTDISLAANHFPANGGRLAEIFQFSELTVNLGCLIEAMDDLLPLKIFL